QVCRNGAPSQGALTHFSEVIRFTKRVARSPVNDGFDAFALGKFNTGWSIGRFLEQVAIARPEHEIKAVGVRLIEKPQCRGRKKDLPPPGILVLPAQRSRAAWRKLWPRARIQSKVQRGCAFRRMLGRGRAWTAG